MISNRGKLYLVALVVVIAGVALVVAGMARNHQAPSPHPAGRIDATGPVAGSTHSGRSGPSDHASSKRVTLGPSAPQRLRIPALGIDTAVNPIGLAPNGEIAVPVEGPHLNEAAWFKNSPTPGQLGASVIEGHVDSVEGNSVFYRLGEIKVGDRIIVNREDGIKLVFTVNAVRNYLKSKFPTAVVYGGQLSRPTLRLITCSDFVQSIRHHIGNEVVFSHLTKITRPAAH